MTSKLIFKMELFKFFKDKSILITAAVIGVLNIILTLLLLNIMNVTYNYYDDATAHYYTLVGSLTFIVFIGNFIFALMFPFHMISMDYKNNVMAMMVASGVNRTKLYVSKIGAVLLCSIMITLAITLVPVILVTIKMVQTDTLNNFIEGFSFFFRYSDLSWFQVITSGILSYLSSLIMISTACILMKGRNIAFLLYVGLSIAVSVISGILGFLPLAFEFSLSGIFWYNNFLSVIGIAVFAYIALSTLKRQNL